MEAPQTDATSAGTGAPQESAADQPQPPEHPAAGKALGASLGLSALLVVGVRLGASLLGLRVFAGLNLLSLFAPWSSLPSSRPLTTSIYVSDQLDSTFPALHEIAQRFWHGDLSSWSGLVGGGTPLLSTPDFSLLTPGRWLFLVLPTWLAPAWAKLFEMAFSALFSYLLVRRLRGSKVAAGLAGFSYPLTGFMISWTNWSHVTVAAVIPMLFWSIERFVQERRFRTAVPVALATALLLFGGFPAVAGQALYFGGGYALVRVITERRTELRALGRDIGLLLLAVGVGIGLTAAQLLPFAKSTLAGSDLAYRTEGFFVHDGYRYLLTTIFPGSFSGNQLAPGASPMDLDTYLGSAVLLLAVVGLLQAFSGRIRRTAGLYFVAMILFIVGVLWFQGAWSNWIDKLPVFHGNPINRIRSQLALPVVVLAAAGFDLLRGIRLDGGWWRRVGQVSAWPAVIIAAAFTLVTVVLGIKILDPSLLGLAKHRQHDVLLAVVPLVLITLLLLVGIRFRAARLLALVLVLFSIGGQALAATAFFWPTAPRAEFYPDTGATRFLQQNLGHDRMATLGYAIRPNATEYYGLRVLNGHAFFPKDLHSVLTGIDPGSFVGNTYSIFTPAVAKVVNSPGLGRMGVRYLVGEENAVAPASRSSVLPILGAPDPIPTSSGDRQLQAGQAVRTTIAGGPIRAINVPLVASAARSTITVTLRSSAGAVLASNRRSVSAGSVVLPIALAADQGSSNTTGRPDRLSVEVSSDVAGVTLRTGPDDNVLVQPVRPSASDSRVRMAYAGDNLVIYERLDYLPRIRWASRDTVIADPAARLAAVTTGALDPAGVILAAPPPAPLGNADGAPQQFRIEEDSGDTIRVHVQTATAGMVVVADSVTSNFDATVDGKSRPIESADYAVGAVYVPAGSHEIALHYDPPGRKNGDRISAVSAVLLLAAILPSAWWGRLRRRRREPRSGSRPDPA